MTKRENFYYSLYILLIFITCTSIFVSWLFYKVDLIEFETMIEGYFVAFLSMRTIFKLSDYDRRDYIYLYK